MFDKINWRHFVNEKLSGRKVNRWTVNLLCAGLSACLVWAAWRWANGAVLPDLPGQAVMLGAIPYLQSILDNWIRSSETRTALHTNAPGVNPHGGPGAP